MADLPSDFWSGYIIGISVISFICLAWLVYNVYFTDSGDPELADRVWDEDLREGGTPAPMWWFWLIFATMVFSVFYLMLYPGLGSFKGMLDWSQAHEIEMAQQRYDASFGPERDRLAAEPHAALAGEPAAMRSASNLFRAHCSACHGTDLSGQAALFPSLIDAEWQWGGDAERIAQTIVSGRTGVMPPWIGALQPDGVAEVTDYVIAMADGRADDPAVAAGKTRYDQFCVACHLPDGRGNTLLGAPALNNGLWLYGGDYDSIYASIADGRGGEMPRFRDRLDDTQVKLLTAWLLAGAPD